MDIPETACGRVSWRVVLRDTRADQPDAAKLQAKLQEVERLRTNERLAFIREVGEATKVLTPEQRNLLLGTATPKK